MYSQHGVLHHAGGGRKGSNVNYVRQVPKFLQGHMHLLGARTDEDVQEQLTAKREMPQWDSEEDEAAEKEVSVRVQHFTSALPSTGQVCCRRQMCPVGLQADCTTCRMP